MRKASSALVAALSSIFLCVGIAAADGHGHMSQFSNADFSGTYVNFFHGTTDGTGTLVSDGKGNITGGNETVSDGTNVCLGTLGGTYVVNTDGTGTMVTTFTTAAMGGTIAGACPSSPVTHNSSFVMTSRRYVNTVETDAGLLVLGHLTKQHRDGNEGE
jgi:hypothetical protein